jgi:secondary thiamine-phosphate synthase enzyme
LLKKHLHFSENYCRRKFSIPKGVHPTLRVCVKYFQIRRRMMPPTLSKSGRLRFICDRINGRINSYSRKKMKTLEIQTRSREELIDITAKIEQVVYASGITEGICCIYVPHTTAGVTINENADPSVKRDILMAMRKMIPDTWEFAHAEGNSPAHVKSSMVGPSLPLIIDKGKLALGTWQGVIFCEFDGPRNRKVFIQIISA